MSEVLGRDLATYQDFNQQVLLLGDKVLDAMVSGTASSRPVSSTTNVRSEESTGLILTSNTLRTNYYNGGNIALYREMTEADGLLVPVNTGIAIEEVTPKGKKNKVIDLFSRTLLPEQIGWSGIQSEFFITETVYNEPRKPFRAVLSYSASMSGTGVITTASDLWTSDLIKNRTSVSAFTRQIEGGEELMVGLDAVKEFNFSKEALDYVEVLKNAQRIINAAKSSTAVKQLLKRK